MKIITLECLFNNDQTQQLDDLEIEFDPGMCDLETVYFNKIDCFYECYEGKYVTVFSGGVKFIVNITIKDLINLLDEK